MAGPMKLPKTRPDVVLDPSDVKCPGYRNINTAWWDASMIYGSSETTTQTLRDKHPDGKLALTEKGTVAFLPRDSDGNPLTGFNNNWWMGKHACPSSRSCAVDAGAGANAGDAVDRHGAASYDFRSGTQRDLRSDAQGPSGLDGVSRRLHAPLLVIFLLTL